VLGTKRKGGVVMKPRKCKWCEVDDIVVDKENRMGAVYYNKSYYHKECFEAFCAKKMSAKKPTINWEEILNDTPRWQEDAKGMMAEAVVRDDLYHFLLDSYNLSMINGKTWKDFDLIYKGTYRRLAYAIGPEELLNEWKYYLDYLREGRKFKTMTNDQALNYDLVVVLCKNAEYRELMEKKKVEEQVKAAQKKTEINIDWSSIQGSDNISRGNRRLANLYEEFIGGGNNG
jgi:hypothetical protein